MPQIIGVTALRFCRLGTVAYDLGEDQRNQRIIEGYATVFREIVDPRFHCLAITGVELETKARSMPLYTFKLEKFDVDNERSRHEDTDEVTFGLQVGSQRFSVQSFSAGDVNNGDHGVNLVFGPVFISDSASPVIFSYQIYNGDSSKLQVSLAALNNDLANQALTFMQQKIDQGNPADYTDFPSNQNPDKNKDDNVPFNDGSWIQFLEFVALGSFLFPDCDGFVAVGTIGKEKSEWDRLIDSAGGTTYTHSIRYPGSDSPAGCGSNSDYTVTWSVTSKRIIGGPGQQSLRQFLQAYHVTLRPRICSMGPTNPPINARKLMT